MRTGRTVQFVFCSLLLIFGFSIVVPYAQDSAVSRKLGSGRTYLELEDAVSAAMVHSGERKVKLLEEMKSGYAVDEARAGMLPAIDFQATSSYMFNPPEGVVLPKGAMGYEPNQYSQAPVPFPEEDYPMMDDPANTYFSITADLRQPLFTWGKLRTGLDLANMNRRLSGLEREVAETELKKQVRRAYYAISFARSAEQKLLQVKDLLQQILMDREKEYRENLINLQTVLEAQKNILVLETKIEEVREGYVNAAEGFYLLTGLYAAQYELEALPEYRDTDFIEADTVLEKSLYQASEVRIAAVEQELAGLNAKLEERSGQLRPDIFLNIGLEIKGEQVPVVQPNWIETWNGNLTLTLGTTFTVWDSGLSAAKRRQAAITEQIAAEGLKQRVWNTEKTVQGLLARLNVAESRLKAQIADRTLLEEQLKNAEVSFANDLITRSERLGASAALLRNEVEYLSSLLMYHTTLAEISALCGSDALFTASRKVQ